MVIRQTHIFAHKWPHPHETSCILIEGYFLKKKKQDGFTPTTLLLIGVGKLAQNFKRLKKLRKTISF